MPNATRKPSPGPHSDAFTSDAGGVTLLSLFIALSVVVLGALAVDVSNVYHQHNRMQATADAAALAAAHSLPDEAIATMVAHTYVERNLPVSAYGAAENYALVTFGAWDAASQSILPTPSASDTVTVTLIRSNTLGGQIPTMMMFLIGMTGWDTAVQASASAPASGACVGGSGGLPDIASLSPFTLLGNRLLLHNVGMHGDVAVSPGGSISHSSASDIYGDTYYGPDVTELSFDGTFTGTQYYDVDLADAQAQVYSASTAMAMMTPDYAQPSVSNRAVFDAVNPDGVTVINIGDVDLGGSDRIELNGGEGDYFVVNISDSSPKFGGSSGIVGTGSVTPDHILINFTSGGNLGTVAQINAVLNGSIFVPYASATFHSANGALFGGLGELKLMSDATLTGVPFASPCVTETPVAGGQWARMRG